MISHTNQNGTHAPHVAMIITRWKVLAGTRGGCATTTTVGGRSAYQYSFTPAP